MNSPIDAEFSSLFDEMTSLARAVGAGSDAEDIAQETLLHARAKVEQLREPDRLRPWLRRSTVRRTLEKRRRREVPLEERLLLPHRDLALGLDVRRAIAALPERERLAVTLVYALGYSQEEAAAALGVRRGTVASSLFRARTKLTHALVDYRNQEV